MKDTKLQKLIFIYNADSGIRNMIMDSAHKIFSPDTYECSLCDITYGAFTENSVWKKYRKETNLQMEFLHKDEFAKAYASKFGYKFTFPIVLAETNDGLEIFVKTEELDKAKNAEELIGLIKERSL
ncbi:GTPase [Maribacter sp. 2308TA10-17]|uniref:GTPase n=1 Tax=Maribacter sp. 2308TA10-17 TaxID=3386276 RepID=UPI0039BC3CC4